MSKKNRPVWKQFRRDLRWSKFLGKYALPSNKDRREFFYGQWKQKKMVLRWRDITQPKF